MKVLCLTVYWFGLYQYIKPVVTRTNIASAMKTSANFHCAFKFHFLLTFWTYRIIFKSYLISISFTLTLYSKIVSRKLYTTMLFEMLFFHTARSYSASELQKMPSLSRIATKNTKFTNEVNRFYISCCARILIIKSTISNINTIRQ